MHSQRIVPNLDDDESPTAISDSSDSKNELSELKSSTQSPKFSQKSNGKAINNLKCLQSSAEDDEIGDGLRTKTTTTDTKNENNNQQTEIDRIQNGQIERRRRKLPEIPKNKKCKF